MYVDSAYITKFYVNERDSAAVRKAILAADTVLSSAWVLSEVTCALHRHMREGSLNRVQFRLLPISLSQPAARFEPPQIFAAGSSSAN